MEEKAYVRMRMMHGDKQDAKLNVFRWYDVQYEGIPFAKYWSIRIHNHIDGWYSVSETSWSVY